MPARSAHYGVKRLIAINSGKYSYAEIDLTSPVHLSAPNNQGKSTLVNALQFLYVDELRYMGFGARSVDDTRRHYFGENPSYLLFECLTPLGPKCMLLAGQGPLNNCQFLRFVFDGLFELDTVRDEDNRLLTLDQLRLRLAGRGLMEVRPSNLWEVLGDPGIPSDSGSLPRLNILPIRTKDEYRSFRAAFVRLLALSNVTAKELREIIITCHARDVPCRRIDVAAEHRDDFQRAEQTEQSMRFTLTVRDHIDKGRALREDIEGIAQLLRTEAPAVAEAVAAVFMEIDQLDVRQNDERHQIEARLTVLNEQIREGEREVGALDEQRKAKQGELNELDTLHNKWALCSESMIQSMRDNLATLTDQISRLRDDIEDADRLDLEAIRRRADALERERGAKQRTLDNWDTRAINTLRDSGVSDADIEQVFRLLNAGLLDLSIGKEIVIHDLDRLRKDLAAIRALVNNDRFADDAVTVELHGLDGPSLGERQTREDVQNDLRVLGTQLARVQEQLHVAEDQARAESKLADMQRDQRGLSDQLREYDDYRKEWSNRTQITTSIQALADEIESAEGGLAELTDEVDTKNKRMRELLAMQSECGRAREDISVAVDTYRSEEAEAGVDSPLLTASEPEVGPGDAPSLHEVKAHVEAVSQRLTQMLEGLRSSTRKRRQVQEIQKQIREKSRQYAGQTVYFSDEDADWSQLIEMVESLSEQQEAVEQAWASLFTRVAAKLSDIRHGVNEIRSAINRINRGLAEYRVSNLRSVKLEVVPVSQTYNLIETLTNEGGIFQDHEKIERAKEQTRRWIKEGRTIALDELFELHIHVHDMARERPTQAKSLDEIGSTGTGMTAKAMVFIQLVRAVVNEERYRLHFFLDETGQLDERNLAATTKMAVDRGVMPITADPDVRIESLAHPTVTVYSLGQSADDKFLIDGRRTCHGRRIEDEAIAEEAV